MPVILNPTEVETDPEDHSSRPARAKSSQDPSQPTKVKYYDIPTT
jgi:hypothetical protein